METATEATNAPPTTVPLTIRLRRERMFLLLAGVFLGCLTMLNIIGITRFLVLGSWDDEGFRFFAAGNGGWTFAVAAGVLPYPLTFLCTDLISEFYGRRRANWLVMTGLLLNVLVVAVIWLGTSLPSFAPIDAATGYPDPPTFNAETGQYSDGGGWTLFHLRTLAFGAVFASMIAYLAAQFCDVYLFHFWKRLTAGRALWLRNNASTIASQFVDTFAVITITHFYAKGLPIDSNAPIWPQLWVFILTGYAFKVVAALLDTPVIYAAVALLKAHLQIDPTQMHDDEVEAAGAK